MKENKLITLINKSIVLLVLLNIPLNAGVYQNKQENIKKRSLLFIENKGQITDTNGNLRPDIAYIVEACGLKLYFTKTGVSYVFRITKPADEPNGCDQQSASGLQKIYFNPVCGMTGHAMAYRTDMELVGKNSKLNIIGENESAVYFTYYKAQNPAGGTKVKAFRKLVYKNVYDNIDMVFYSNDHGLRYDFVVKPGGQISDIRLRYRGAEKVTLTKQGRLRVINPLGHIIEGIPIACQVNTITDNFIQQNHFNSVNSSYKLINGSITFDIGDYNHNKTLVIDPDLEWATYYGGNADDIGGAVVSDQNGDIIMLGYTESSDFPVTNGAFQTFNRGNKDVFVVKLDAYGNRIWATYYGGSSEDLGLGMAIDSNNNILITGTSHSDDFPITNGALQTSQQGAGDVFVLKLAGSGARQWATFYGGSYYDYGKGITTDNSGNICVSGVTYSVDFPITAGAFQSSNAGSADDFVVKLDRYGNRQWATYFGGSREEIGRGLAIDQNEDIVIAGRTYSSDIPITSGAFQSTNGGNADVYVAKFNNNGELQWATYYGGSDYDDASPAIDETGNVYIGGTTLSSDLPVSGDAFQVSRAGYRDAFWVKLSSQGNLLYSTYYGGSNDDWGRPLTIDKGGNLWFLGDTESPDFPITADAIQTNSAGKSDLFLLKFSKGGSREWATYYGGTNDEYGLGIYVGNDKSTMISGVTRSTDFPVTSGSFQPSFGGGNHVDAFIIKLSNQITAESFISCVVNDHALYQEFHVDIQVEDVKNLFGISFNLNFPANYLEAVSSERGSFLGSDVIFYDNIDNRNGTVSVGVTKKSGQSPASGTGVVTRIMFKEKPSVVTGTDVHLQISEISANDPAGNQIVLTAQDTTYTTQYPTSVEEEKILTKEYTLYPNYPNPFNPTTTISYALPKANKVQIQILDIRGRLVKTLLEGHQSSGKHSVVWDATNASGMSVASGIYLSRLQVGSVTLYRKLVLTK